MLDLVKETGRHTFRDVEIGLAGMDGFSIRWNVVIGARQLLCCVISAERELGVRIRLRRKACLCLPRGTRSRVWVGVDHLERSL